ncbi:MAG TPA: hypothetical protein VGO00_20950 [Kofleriaceae bacterium]|nr:hypothetical protein [Kofleriaceae bacterium]
MRPYLVVLAGCHAAVPSAPSCDRDVMISSPDDVAAIASCTSVRALSIKTAASIQLGGLRLESIAGDLRVGPTVAMDEMSLPVLRTVGGAVHVSANGSLHGVFLPALEHAGRIEVTGNVELATLSIPKLAETDALVVTDCAELEVIDAGSLVTVTGDVVVAGAPNLDVVDAPHLARIHTLRIDAAPKLPTDVVDRLTAALSPR